MFDLIIFTITIISFVNGVNQKINANGLFLKVIQLIMIYILCIFYLSWFLIVVLYQFSDNFKKHVTPFIFRSGLVPNWRLFSPRPVQGDYLIHFRLYHENEKRWDNWKDWDYFPQRSLISVFFNPQANIHKSVRGFCESLKKTQDSPNYRKKLLLNLLRKEVTRNYTINNKFIQFRIIYSNAKYSQLTYVSKIHDL